MSQNQHSLSRFRVLVLGEETFQEEYNKDISSSLGVELIDVFDKDDLIELLEHDSDFDMLFVSQRVKSINADELITELFQLGYGYIPVCLIHDGKSDELIEDCKAVGGKDFLAESEGLPPIKALIEKSFKFKDEQDVG